MTDTYTIAPLVWKYSGETQHQIAQTIFGEYVILDGEPTKLVTMPNREWLEPKTIFDGKAACQADYEARLKECLVLVERIECGKCGWLSPVVPDLCTRYECETPKARFGPCEGGINGDKKS